MSLRESLIRNLADVELTTTTRAPLYNGAQGAKVIGPRVPGVAAKKLGASYDVLPPGKAGCPYHCHHAQEEMAIILEGEGTLRVADERFPIRAGDVICIPAGPAYPHQILNTSNADLRYLSVSTQERPEICEYPDSGKYLADPQVPGLLIGDGRIHRAEDDLDYWDGEP